MNHHSVIFALFGALLLSHAQAQTLGTNLVVDTFVGSDFQGTVNGQGTRAMLNKPHSIVFGDGGTLYCWQPGGVVRVIDTNAVVTTTNVKNQSGFWCCDPYDLIYHDGALFGAFSGAISTLPATGFATNVPGSTVEAAVWHSTQAGFFATDESRSTIVKIVNGTASVFVGSGNHSQIDGSDLFSSFLNVQAILVNPAGELLVVDDHSLRKVTLQGDVSTLIPQGKFVADKVSKFLLLNDGRILATKQHQVLLFDVDGTSSVVAGSTQPGFQDGPVASALFNTITGMALAPAGDLFIADSANNRIRRIHSAFQAQPPPAAETDINLFAGITITGIPGRSYRIESSPSADAGPWTTEETLQLPDSPYLWLDKKSASGSRKFYRVLSL